MRLIINKELDYINENVNIKIIEITSTDFLNDDLDYFVYKHQIPLIKFIDTEEIFIINNFKSRLNSSLSETVIIIDETDLESISNSGSEGVQSVTGDGVDNTDPQNPVIDTSGLAPLTSPLFIGIPQAPTANKGVNTDQIATTAFVLANLSNQFMNASAFEAYGDSITVGQNSSPTSNSYINLLASLYSKTVTNRAVSGRGIWQATVNHFANITTSSTVLAILMAGFNDVRRGGSATKTRNKIINGYKSILANHFLASFIAANTVSSSITKSGTWSGYTGASVGAKTNSGTYSSINGNYIEYTFTDNNVVVGLVAADGVSQIYGDFTVLIDGVSQGSFSENNQTDGISDGNDDNARSAMCLIFSGLSEGAHTIRLTNTTSLSFVVDYFGHLKQPKFCTPILIMQAPKMDVTGYATAPNLANDTVINQLNADILALVAAFPPNYPIVVADTNAYYNVSTGLDTADHIHPNNVGHRQIYEAGYRALNPLLLGGSLSATVVDATVSVKGILKLAGDLAGTADLPTVPALANKLNTTANSSLAGTGTRMMEAAPDGTPTATYVKYQMKVSDSDIITAITGATYVSGIATITPASSKVMLEGQVYQSGLYLYRAYSDNVVLRTAIV